MEKFIFGMLLGMVIGAAGSYFYHRGGDVKVRVPEGVTDDVQTQLSRYGVIIKEKARDAGHAIADATADSRATAAIKSKLATELGASSLANISVSTSDGVTTLSGTVESQADVDKAVGVAYSTEGVHKVYSTVQVKGSK
jgi:osmotically-inducible protein OsmY